MSSGRRCGFVLMVALWLVVAISAIALQAGAAMRIKRLALRNAADQVLARSSAHSGLALARSELTAKLRTQEPLDPWASVHELAVADTMSHWRFTLRYEDAESRLNVNISEIGQLTRLFAALAIDDPAGLADIIAAARMKSGPFRDLSDVAAIDGMDADTYARLENYITVTGPGRINLNSASVPVLLSLPEMNDRVVTVIERLRRSPERIVSTFQIVTQLDEPDRSRWSLILPALQYATTVETKYVIVTSAASARDSVVRAQARAAFVREGTARLLGVQWF